MTASIVFAVVLLVAGHRRFVAGLATGFVCGLSVRPTKDLGRTEREVRRERKSENQGTFTLFKFKSFYFP